jgi:sulfoxide reductase heme-binding subunit YedZ
MKHPTHRFVKRTKGALFIICLLPLARLIYLGVYEDLGANPVEAIMHSTGSWSLILLLSSLAITPLRNLTGWQWLVRLRRMVSLYAFFYATLHFVTYLVLDQAFDWVEVAKDIVKRPFITIGFAAFVLMIPLAITSTDGMFKRMGEQRWRRLHRLVYLLGIGGVLHYFWLVKRDITMPTLYILILAVLLCARMAFPAKSKLPKSGSNLLSTGHTS